MPPELINRLDELVLFNSLTPEDMRSVTNVRLGEASICCVFQNAL